MGSLTSETPTFETLRIAHEGRIGRITLDRPEKLNPLSTLCLEELALAAKWFNGQDAIRVVVVTGAGRAFTAGADLSAFSGADAGRLMAEAIESMQAVTIAAIHGHCVGGGVVLAGACDFRVAAESTRFSIPEVDLGIPLAWGGIPRLVREIGPAATRDLVMTCRPFTALEAHVRGFVTRMVDDDKLGDEVEDLAATLAAKSSLTLRATLIAVDAAVEALVSTRFAWSDADVLVNAMHDPESREVGAAYLRERGR
jgi:enoyl-CoA hydratase/carnithine racemase